MKKKIEEKIVCNRCGNHDHIACSLWFAHAKVRVYLCDVCWFGLCLGLKLDLERELSIKEGQNRKNISGQ